MRIVKFVPDRDLDRLEAYLADRCLESRRAATWLPARLHDLIFRVGRQESDDGREISAEMTNAEKRRMWEAEPIKL